MTAIAFIRKEFIHIFRDWRTTLITLVMPVVLLLNFGLAISTEVNNVEFMAVAMRPSEDIRKQIETLAHNPLFTFKGMISEKDIHPALRSGKADLVLVYDTHGKCQLVVDASDANISASATMYAQQTLTPAGKNTASTLFSTTLRHNPQMLSAYNFVPGVMGLLFLLICALMTSASIVREKETGTIEVLFVSPIRPIVIIFAKLLPFFVISCIDLATILLLVHFAMGVPLASLGGIVLVSLIYIILSLALGMLVSTITDKQIVALLVCAMVMMLPVMMFSGMIFPVDNLPWILRPLPCIVPARWYIDAMRKLMIEGVAFNLVLKEFFILSGMAILFIGVALHKFNDRLQ